MCNDAVNRVTLQVYFTGSEASTCAGTTNNTASPATPNVTYAYDTGIPNAHGRLVSVTNSAATDQILGYDELGRITGSSQAIGGGAALPFSYTYNLADALVQTTYPTGRVVTNSYDAANRINGVTGLLNGNSTPYVSGTCSSGICYAASGAPSGFAYGNNVARAYTYNSRLQPTLMTDTLSSSTLLSLAYTFGVTTTTNNGNPSQVVIGGTGSGSGGYTQTYTYDPLNRLHTFADNGGSGVSQTLSHDQFGNMWQSAQTGLSGSAVPALAAMPTAQSSINAANNQLTSAVGAYYDSGGNQTSFLSATPTYDAENRQVQVETGTSTYYYYTYDGLGERVSRTVGTGTPTYYVHDAFGNLASEYNPPAAAACGTCYLSWDHLGSTRMVTDGSTGAIVARHDFLPFGVEIPSGVAGRSGVWNVTDGLSPKFTGQDHDTETFLEFYQARYMASGQGRFMSLDPGNAGADITDPQSWNMYSYALNNPLRYVDPFGLCSQDASGNFVDDDNGGAFQFSGPCVQGNTVTETAPPVETQNSETDDFLNTTFYADSFSSAFQVDVGQNVPPGTPQKYLGPLKQGLDNARAALKRKRCADFYGGQGPQTLDATRYRFLDMGNPTTGAATISPTEVFVNTNGAYMTYSPAIGQAGPFGRFWTQGQFRGFILLHELGHQLSNITDFQADLGSPLNQIQSQRVLAACF